MESLSLKNPDDISETETSKNSVSFSDQPSGPITPEGPPPPLNVAESLKETSSHESIPYNPESIPYNPDGAESPQYIPNGAESPQYIPNGAESPPYNPYGPVSPLYAPNSPAYAPNSPAYAPNSPAYAPIYGKYESPIHSPEPYITTPKTPQTTPPKIPAPPKVVQNDKKKQGKKIMDIYTRTLVSKKVSVEMKYVGINIKENLEKKLKETHEGRCIAEGYVKKNTVKIITYSAGKICTSGILYEVAFECYVCFPVEGQLLNCIATNITKAGIKATSLETPSPFVVFISRDHQLSNKKFSTITEKDHFVARIIGQRFELNDPYISIIAEIDEKKRYIKNI